MRNTTKLAPNDLVDIISEEAASLRTPEDDIPSTLLQEQSIRLIGKVWNLPSESIKKALERIEHAHTSDCADREMDTPTMKSNPSGVSAEDIMEGLFETAVHLASEEERSTICEMANYMATVLNLDMQDVVPSQTTYSPITEVTPKDLIERIVDEAIAELALEGCAAIPHTDLHAESIRLIGRAWGLPQAEVDASTNRLVAARVTAFSGNCVSATRADLTPDLLDQPSMLQMLGLLAGTAFLLRSEKEAEIIQEVTQIIATYLGLAEMVEDGWSIPTRKIEEEL